MQKYAGYAKKICKICQVNKHLKFVPKYAKYVIHMQNMQVKIEYAEYGLPTLLMRTRWSWWSARPAESIDSRAANTEFTKLNEVLWSYHQAPHWLPAGGNHEWHTRGPSPTSSTAATVTVTWRQVRTWISGSAADFCEARLNPSHTGKLFKAAIS